MTINGEVQLNETDPHPSLQCTLRRTRASGLHVRVAPHLDATTFGPTIEALACQLVLVPRYVVLEPGPLWDRSESEMIAISRMVALIHRAEIALRVVLPESESSDQVLAIGVTPADGLFRSLESAERGRADN